MFSKSASRLILTVTVDDEHYKKYKTLSKEKKTEINAKVHKGYYSELDKVR